MVLFVVINIRNLLRLKIEKNKILYIKLIFAPNMGEKRKPELDLSVEESNDKKQKVDNNQGFDFGGFAESQSSDNKDGKEAKMNAVMKGFNIRNIIDFSDTKSREKYYPDCDIISKDGIILKYHRCKLVDNSIFNQLINEMIQENPCKITLQLYDGRTINLVLNYLYCNNTFIL